MTDVVSPHSQKNPPPCWAVTSQPMISTLWRGRATRRPPSMKSFTELTRRHLWFDPRLWNSKKDKFTFLIPLVNTRRSLNFVGHCSKIRACERASGHGNGSWWSRPTLHVWHDLVAVQLMEPVTSTILWVTVELCNIFWFPWRSIINLYFSLIPRHLPPPKERDIMG